MLVGAVVAAVVADFLDLFTPRVVDDDEAPVVGNAEVKAELPSTTAYEPNTPKVSSVDIFDEEMKVCGGFALFILDVFSVHCFSKPERDHCPLHVSSIEGVDKRV